MQVFAGTARNAAGRFLRAWWPELLACSILAAVGSAGQRNDPFFAVFMVICGFIFWAMGFRHRVTPLHTKVDRIDGNVTEVQGTINAVHTMLAEQDVQDEPDDLVHPDRHLHVVPS